MVTLCWDKENPDETALAEKKFIEYTRKGWLAFAVTSGDKKKQLLHFDPKLRRIQLVPLVEGG